MTFAHDLADFINEYSRARKAMGVPLYVPEAVEALTVILKSTLDLAQLTPAQRATLVAAIGLDIGVGIEPASKVLN